MNSNEYDDIIDLPRHISATRPHMSVYDRSAQFAPFAALSGHGAAVAETARLTKRKIEIDDAAKALLDERLRWLLDREKELPVAVFTFFVPDAKKSGGEYVTESGVLKKIDMYKKTVTLVSGTELPIDNLFQIDGEMFDTDAF